MKKEMNNKGFSLVELIIVIAIMAVLIGVLAPQYLKYVKQSKVSTDITNAEEIATAVSVAIADGTISLPAAAAAMSASDIAKVSNLSLPYTKLASKNDWVITLDDKGVKEIKVSDAASQKQIWPNPDASGAYRDSNK